MKWPEKKLGDICKFAYGDSLPKQNRIDGKIHVYGSNGIVGNHNQSITLNETIIVGRKGSAGQINWSEKSCYPIDTTYFIDKNFTDQNLRWLYWYLKQLRLNELNKAAAVPGLNRDDAYRIKILLPPLAEQQRIATLLDTADQILKKRESAIAKLDQLAQSVFLNELRAYDSSSFQLAEVAEMYQPKTISANELIENGEYVVYGANGVIGRYDKFNHADSEVLVTCRGATCGTVNRSQPLAWITGNAMVVKPLNNIATKDFLHYYFKFVADFSSVITGAAQPQITRQTLSRLMIEIPKLENQNEITNEVREIYKKHEIMNLSKNKLQELTGALQHQSFAVN